MRLYLIHRKYYNSYLNAQRTVEEILDEQEILLQKVQPKSSLANHDREFLPTNIGAKSDIHKTEAYVIEMERRELRERLSDATDILKERHYLLAQKEEELRKSRDIYNMIYLLKFVDGLKADAIAERTGYSRSQVYNIIGHLNKQLERNEE